MRKRQTACETKANCYRKTSIFDLSLMEKVKIFGPRKRLSHRVFRGCCEAWEVRVVRCIAFGLNYFEEVYSPFLLTPCITVLLEKLIGSHPGKKFPAFNGAQSFITAFTSARHLFLS
jgi:hypothetical protein